MNGLANLRAEISKIKLFKKDEIDDELGQNFRKK
jgi:hypothetical protein